MMMRKLLLFLALALLLAGCDDPVKVEKANAIRRESQVAATATIAAVQIEVKAADIAIAATATRIADEEAVAAATQAERIVRTETLVTWSGWVIVTWLVTLAVGFCIFSIGGSVAASRKANLEARLIRLDKTTRTWPVMLDTKTGILVDLETGERARLGDVSAIDHRRLIISGQVRTTGLLAQAAENIAKSTKDAKPGDMLAAIGQSVPLLKEAEETALAIPARTRRTRRSPASPPPCGSHRRGGY